MRAWLALGLVLAAGCGDVAARPRPGDPELASISSATVAGVSTLAATLARPRRLGIDLRTAIELAGARSPELFLARVAEEDAENRIQAAEFQFFPKVYPVFRAFDHRGQAQTQSALNVNVDRTNFETQVLPAFDWDFGPYLFQALAEHRRKDAAAARAEAVRLDTVVAAAQGYFELVRAVGELAVARQALVDAQELTRHEESRERLGAGVRSQVLRARAELADRRLDLAAVNGRIAIASARLAAVLQLDPGVELVPRDVVPAPVAIFSSDATVMELVEHALQARPEVQEADETIFAVEHEREGALYGPLVPFVSAPLPGRAAYPGIVPATRGFGSGEPWAYGMYYTPWAPFGATGRTGFFGPSLSALSFSQDWIVYAGWQFGPRGILDVPAVRGRSLAVQGAHVENESLRARIVREVSEARAETVAAQGRLDAARAGMVAASEALRLTKDRFDKGVAIELEVLDAEDVFVRARLALVESAADFDVAQYRLLRATGTTPP